MYVQIKEQTSETLKLCREPSVWSFSLVAASVSLGIGAAIYSNDSLLWNSLYVILGLIAGLSCLEDWEECEFDKKSGEVIIKRISIWDHLQHLFTGKEHQLVLANLHDIVGVRVDEQDVKYFGKGYQVVLLFNTGINFGVTETFTYGNTRDHYMIADKIRDFLELEKKYDDNLLNEDNGDNLLDEGESNTSSVEDFEHIDPADLSNTDETVDEKKST